MDKIVNETDPQQQVFNSMEDFCLNADRRIISPAHSVISSVASGGLDRTISPSIDSFYSASLNSTMSSSPFGHSNQRQYVPLNTIFQNTVTSRPPIPKPPGSYSNISFS